MKLTTRTTQYYVGTFVLVLLMHAAISYFSVTSLVHKRLERALMKEKNTIVKVIAQRDTIPSFPGFGENEWEIEPLDTKPAFDHRFRVVRLFSRREAETLEYYELKTHIEVEGRFYELNIRRSLVQTNELIYSLVISSVLSLLLLIMIWGFFYRRINQKLWLPFYRTLHKLKSYDFRIGKNIHFKDTGIKEFQELNNELNMLTDKLYQDYQGQKHFVENASHELQTPLAVIKTQLELLLQSDRLQKEEIQLVASALDASDRLSKINKSLIILSRIENLQYAETNEVLINDIIDQNMNMFSMEADIRELEIIYVPQASCLKVANETLMHILIRNLIQNAIRHNISSGKVWINLEHQYLEIKNTGNPLTVPPEKLFERFYKHSESEGSIGLGLSIVKEICEIYSFGISYTIQGNIHCLRVEL